MNACVRFIYNLNNDDYVSHCYKTLGWLFADDRRSYLIYCFLFSIIRSDTSSYFASNFRPYTCSRDRTRASLLDFAIPLMHTTTYQHPFHYIGTTMWNSLSAIKNANSLSAFKHVLLCHLQQQTNEWTSAAPNTFYYVYLHHYFHFYYFYYFIF